MSLVLRNLIFTVLMPGTVAVLIPWLLIGGSAVTSGAAAWLGGASIVAGVGLYAWCLSLFGRVGRGTPAPWDAARRLIVVGPYRWVRNPMYLAVLLVIVGEAALFASVGLLVYAGLVAAIVHVFVVGYEEVTLEQTFGADYRAYRQSVWRWIPAPPQQPAS